MKHAPNPQIGILALIAGLVVSTGCQHDGQMIFTNPRTLPTRVSKLDRPRKKPIRPEKAKVTEPRPLPAANGIDVPIVESN